jgi:hypothetical protein
MEAEAIRVREGEGIGIRGRRWSDKEGHSCRGKKQASGSIAITATGDEAALAIKILGAALGRRCNASRVRSALVGMKDAARAVSAASPRLGDDDKGRVGTESARRLQVNIQEGSYTAITFEAEGGRVNIAARGASAIHKAEKGSDKAAICMSLSQYSAAGTAWGGTASSRGEVDKWGLAGTVSTNKQTSSDTLRAGTGTTARRGLAKSLRASPPLLST